MSPAVKKFITLAIAGMLTALATSGLLPESLTGLLSPHAEAIALFLVGLILPEVGKSAPKLEATIVDPEENEDTQPKIAVISQKRSKRS